MIRAGDIISNPQTGETLVFLQTAEDTGGEALRYEVYARPGAQAAAQPLHLHPRQEERFTIKRGMMRVTVNGQAHVYERGDTLIIRPGVGHSWENIGVDDLQFTAEIRPAGRWQDLLETSAALARDDRHGSGRLSRLLQIAVMLDRYPEHIYLAGVSLALQKLGIALLASVGRLLGFQAYRPYFDLDEMPTDRYSAVLHDLA